MPSCACWLILELTRLGSYTLRLFPLWRPSFKRFLLSCVRVIHWTGQRWANGWLGFARGLYFRRSLGVDITGESLTGYFESVLRDLNERERRLNVGAVAVVLGSPDVGLGGHEA